MKLSRLLFTLPLLGGLAACVAPYGYDPYYGTGYYSGYSGGYSQPSYAGGYGYQPYRQGYYPSSQPYYQQGYYPTYHSSTYSRRGPNPLGTLAGAAVGGLLGAQVGSGTGQLAATAGGAALGGVIGSTVPY